MDELRKTARWRKRRIIVNNDGDDVWEAQTQGDIEQGFLVRKTELIEDYLRARSSLLVGSQVDTVFYSTCTAGLSFSHNTKIGYFVNYGVPKELIDRYGRDSLQIQIDFCREKGFEVFWSLRMNDVHDAYPVGSRWWTKDGWHFAPFKRDHPEYLMGKPEDWKKYPHPSPRHGWTSLNFSYPEVREHIFQIIQEVCQRYDVDGVELDFLRHPPFFPPTWDSLPVEQKHLDMMTDLMCRIKNMIQEVSMKRGRPLLIAVRVPMTVDHSRLVGLDVERWLKEDLFDILIPSFDNMTYPPSSMASLEEMIVLGHKYDVPVYSDIQHGFWRPWAFLESGFETFEAWYKTVGLLRGVNSWPGAIEAWRGAAMNMWNSGADGVYLFNVHFMPRHQKLASFLASSYWWEIGDRDLLAKLDKIYGVNLRDRAQPLKEGEVISVNLLVGEDLQSKTLSELKLRLHITQLTIKDDVTVKLNEAVLKNLKPIDSLKTTPSNQWLECQLNPTQIKRGDNKVELILNKRNETVKTSILVDGLLLLVRHKK